MTEGGFITKQQNLIHGSKLPIILSAAALTVGIIALIFAVDREKIAVVRTADLVSKYKGMEDARNAFEEQRHVWQSEIDTLEADYRKSVSELNAEWKDLPEGEQEKRRELVAAQEQNLMRYSQTLEAKVHEEEERLMQGVLNQVNDAVQKYAEQEGYDVIYGATLEGSILHGSDHLDVTDELINVLNSAYSGTPDQDTIK